MKKTALLLAIVMLFCSLNIGAASAVTFFANEGFSDVETYAKPSKLAFKGRQYVAKVIIGGDDKALLLKNGEYSVGASLPIAPVENFYTLQTRIKISDTLGEKKIILTGGSKQFELLKFDRTRNIKNSRNEKIGKYDLGVWIDISVICDVLSSKCDVYVNEEKILSRYSLECGNVTSIDFEGASSSGESIWYVDYIRGYNGGEILKREDVTYKFTNKETDDKSLDLPVMTVLQSQLVVGHDFEDETIGVSPDGFWTTNSPSVQERKDGGGKAFRLQRLDNTVQGNASIDILINSTIANGVIEYDFYAPTPTVGKLFTLRDMQGNFATLLNVYADGTVRTSTGVSVATGVNRKWTNIAVLLDFNSRTYAVYVDRMLKAEGITIPNNKEDSYFQLVRNEIPAGNVGEFWFDNMFAYTGYDLEPYSEKQKKDRDEQKRIQEENERINGPKGDPVPLSPNFTYFKKVNEDVPTDPSAHLGNYDKTKEIFKDAFCVVARNKHVMIGGEKYQGQAPTLYENMKILAPVRMLGAAYGMEIGWDSVTGEVTIGKEIKIKSGDTSFKYKGKTIELSVPVKLVNGNTYIELRPFAEKVLNKYMYQGDYGIAIISDEKLPYAQERRALTYLVFDRPNADTLYNMLVERNPGNAHPRVSPTKEEWEKIKYYTQIDEYARKNAENTMKAAQAAYDKPLPTQRYDETGIRLAEMPTLHETLSLYWAYITTGDEKWFERNKEIAMRMCEYTTWGADTHYLEVGGTAAMMGTFFDLYYDKLTKDERDLIASKIVEFALEPSVIRYHGQNPYRGLDWPINPNNWNIVVNKGLLLAAAAIGDEYESELCMQTLEHALASIELMMPTFAPEGGWGEGAAYWDYTVTNVVIAMSALNWAFGTDFGMRDVPGFMETGYYPFNISGNAGTIGYHDTARGYVLRGSASLFYLAGLSGDPQLATLQYESTKEDAGSIIALMFYNPYNRTDIETLSTDVVYDSAQIAISRSSWGSDAAWMSVHAGANDFAHGHIDIGTFEYEFNGIRFAGEIGKDDYSLPGYWNYAVRNLYVTRAEGHNVYVINPDMGAGQGVRAASTLKQVQAKEQGSIYTVDMTPAYIEDVNRATRGFMLSNNKRIFTVQDEIEPLGDDEYYWFWHTVADIQINEDGKSVTLTRDGRKLQVFFDSNVEFTVEKGLALPLKTSPVVEAQLGYLKNTINKITVRFKSRGGEKINFRAVAVPEDTIYTPSKEIVPIEKWNIPDGPIKINYTLPSNILIDGKPMDGFNPEVITYSVDLLKVPTQMPVISVEGVENYSVIQGTLEKPVYTIKIPSTSDPDFMRVYYVTINVKSGAEKPATAVNKLYVESVEASSVPEPQNPPEHMLDESFDTRWAASGDVWAVFDLGQVRTLTAFGIGVYLGNTRSQSFGLEISEDGVNYKAIVKGRTSRLSASSAEYLELEPVKARYIKFTGTGNSENQFNSITEFEFYGE